MSDRLDGAALRQSPFAATLELHATLPSTNDRAKELARGKAPALIVADRQTAGRGRGVNRWHASTGALTFSLLIDPADFSLTTDLQGMLAIATGLAVIDAVRGTTGIDAGLKWPNDVLVDGKKISGVLIEAPRPDRWVVGVGINVSNRFEQAPPQVAERATSLATIGPPTIARQAVLEAFLNTFQARVTQPRASAAELINDARRSCVLTGRVVTVTDGRRTLTGLCAGLADNGALLIADDGTTTTVTSGSVALA